LLRWTLSPRLQTVRQPGGDQPPVEPTGLRAVLAGIKMLLQRSMIFCSGNYRAYAAGASPGQQTAQLSVQAGGINPRRLAMILSTMRFGSTAVIKCRIGSGV